jgi:hypothetical protein
VGFNQDRHGGREITGHQALLLLLLRHILVIRVVVAGVSPLRSPAKHHQ